MSVKAFDSNHQELAVGDSVKIDASYGGGFGEVVRVNRSGNYVIVKTPKGEQSFQGVDVTLRKSLKGAQGKAITFDKDRAARELEKMMWNATKDVFGVKVRKTPGPDRKIPQYEINGSSPLEGDAAVRKLVEEWAKTKSLKSQKELKAKGVEGVGSFQTMRGDHAATVKGDVVALGSKEEIDQKVKSKGVKSMPLDDELDGDLGAEVKAEPYGAQVLRRFHEDASILMKDYDEMMELLDHDGVKSHLQGHLEGLEKAMQEAEGLFTESYPHLKGLGVTDEEDGIETKDDDALAEDVLDDGDVGMKDVDDAVGADSVNDELDEEPPTGDEVVEGMATKGWKMLGRKNGNQQGGINEDNDLWREDADLKGLDDEDTDEVKALKKRLKALDDEEETKAMDDEDKEEKMFEVAYRAKGAKTWKKKDFEDEDEGKKFIKTLKSKGFDDDQIMTRGGKDIDPNPLEQSDLGKGLDDEDKEKVDEAKSFLKALAEDGSYLDDEKRLNAYALGKALDEIADDEKDLSPMDEDKVEKAFHKYLRKAAVGSDEWAAEEAKEPAHKGKGWHKDGDELDDDKKDFDKDDLEDTKKLCKACGKFLKGLGYEKAFGAAHRAKAAFFKDMLEDDEEVKGMDDEIPADVLGDKDIDPEDPFEPGEMGEKGLLGQVRRNQSLLGDITNKLKRLNTL